MAQTSEKDARTSEIELEVSSIPNVSAKENVGKIQSMRKECQIKSFDGLGPFSYVCRTISFEPNTKVVELSEEDVQAEAHETSPHFQQNSRLVERCIGDCHHYVFAVTEPERVLGFPIEIELGQEEVDDVAGPSNSNNDDDDQISCGYVPTSPPKSPGHTHRNPCHKANDHDIHAGTTYFPLSLEHPAQSGFSGSGGPAS